MRPMWLWERETQKDRHRRVRGQSSHIMQNTLCHVTFLYTVPVIFELLSVAIHEIAIRVEQGNSQTFMV